jgi:hypothetical protein
MRMRTTAETRAAARGSVGLLPARVLHIDVEMA